eukprot:4817661-Prymnesium_polylepis.2
MARQKIDGFAAMEEELVAWMHATYGTVVELFYAHGLRQSPATLKSTGFDVHQDTEDFDFIEYTAVVKLTADTPDEPPSSMRVIGAERDFEYGPGPGERFDSNSHAWRSHLAAAAAAPAASVHHASVAPRSERPHLKLAFFFKKSEKGERRAKRGLSGQSLSDEQLAQRRRAVTSQMEAFSPMAGRRENMAAFGIDSPHAHEPGSIRPPRCGSCTGCMRFEDRRQSGPTVDCAHCIFCLDKPKFGGKNSLKQCCLRMWCVHKIQFAVPAAQIEARKIFGHELPSTASAGEEGGDDDLVNLLVEEMGEISGEEREGEQTESWIEKCSID